ncbi:Retinoid-inducible serine carboxypeptidase [Eumeta japonica]|uniref:Retinoid-inducible serine carboxypeptidase n=1 Tax=Eumeta variegata TaxID=151549 RepID=A0A4C1SWQ3_EUMVA|nr:Retinoid-inducible serine carboxypeptidase [Eumeta japonica]
MSIVKLVLGSIVNTPTSQRKRGDRDERFFGWFHNRRPQRPPFFPGQHQASTPPPRPPTRPPYNSGGIFANNSYRPPLPEQPSEAVKPVQEGGFDTSQTWRPEVIGGTLGQVVGVPARPLRPSPITADEALENYSEPHRRPTEPHLEPSRYPATVMPVTRRPRQRPPHNNNGGGYVEVRDGAFMFYWLYFADGVAKGSETKPLIIWVQGGPGLAASGIGNFAEIGPITMDMEPRNHTWVKGHNLLLIDHPVGTGFSYVTDSSKLVSTDRQIATDLFRLIKGFFKKHKEYTTTATYIFGQSYGGKIVPRLAWYLHSALEKGKIVVNLKGIGIGSGWVDPKESVLIYPGYLYNLGMIDQNTYSNATRLVQKISKAIDRMDYVRATDLQTYLFDALNAEAGIDINFNNVNRPSPYPALEKLNLKVNVYVKPTLSAVVNQSLNWRYISDRVFMKIQRNSMVPSTKFLEKLLNRTQLKIAVYNGNLDVVTPLAGAVNWSHKLKWNGTQEFKEARRTPIRGSRNGFYKSVDKLSFWWVFGSGHWVAYSRVKSASEPSPIDIRNPREIISALMFSYVRIGYPMER